ncbi:hypothetical protein QE367_002453 [Microbacterium paludicola]|uniref:Lipoprotein n=1 Tax=Microbacterium paludicola TaxID=300019 RepID=A0ABU1I2Z3_9MICO|nr:hypothetical protein [Microbacterium paludicola]MDR6168249.1 hypothetical protein [Microbacterium paludicola]
MRVFAAVLSAALIHAACTVRCWASQATASAPLSRPGMDSAAASSAVSYQPANTMPSREGIGSEA